MPYQAEKIKPFNSTENKASQVERMFDDIAANYDTLNRTLSFGIDKRWRKKGILALKDKAPQHILDIATGTGDLAIEAYQRLQPHSIVGIDISEKMMEIGKEKVKKLQLNQAITFAKEDCTQLSFSDNSFDAAIVAFGVRNFENLDKGIQEIARVLQSGGQLMILELSSPTSFPMKQLYRLYSTYLIPNIGKLLSKNKAAYSYLPQSIAAFPQGEQMVHILLKNGFSTARFITYTLGVCTLYLATK